MPDSKRLRPNAPAQVPKGIHAWPVNRAGELTLQIYAAALKAVRADALLQSSVWLTGELLSVQGEEFDLRGLRRILVVGAGKASAGMAVALEDILGDRISDGLVITKRGH